MPPADECPDGVFIEDTVVMFRNVAVLSRPGADSRRPEVAGVEETMEALGCSLNRIRPPGHLTVAMCSRSETPSTSGAEVGPTQTAYVS